MPKKRETHHIPPEIIGRAKARYEAGDRVEDIEKDLGISKNSVVNHAKKNGWKHGSNKAEIVAKVAQEEKVKQKIQEEKDLAKKKLEDRIEAFHDKIRTSKDPNDDL